MNDWIETSNMSDFNVDNRVDFPNYEAAFHDQMESYLNDRPYNLDAGSDQPAPTFIDGQYQLPEFPPYHLFLDASTEAFPSGQLASDYGLSQQSQNLRGGDEPQHKILQQPQNRDPFDSGHGTSDGCGITSGSIETVPFSLYNTSTANDSSSRFGISTCQQANQFPEDPLAMDSQNSFSSALLSHLDRPLRPEEILTHAPQPMVSLFFFC